MYSSVCGISVSRQISHVAFRSCPNFAALALCSQDSGKIPLGFGGGLFLIRCVVFEDFPFYIDDVTLLSF